jgi:ribosomal protein S18 acetylase RimI-like enzyme
MRYTLTIRDAVDAETPQVAALVESAYRGEPSRAGWTTEADLLDGPRTSAAEISTLLTIPGSRILVALDGTGELVGCCHLALQAGTNAYFGMFAVSPTRQSAGIGRTLLDEAERIAAVSGAGSLHLTVLEQRTDIIAWYERRGYAPTGTGRPFPDSATSHARVAGLRFADMAKRLDATPGAGEGGGSSSQSGPRIRCQ